MLSKSILAFATLLAAANALPWATTTSAWGKATTTTSTWGASSTKPASSTPTWGATTTTPSPAPTPINNGQNFTNYCENIGISVADCSQLLNIAALNGNTINVGGTSVSSGSSNPVNNGQEFLNECKNFGISILDCAQLLNVAILNGNTIDISTAGLLALLSALGLSTTVLSGLPLPTGTSLVTLPTGIV